MKSFGKSDRKRIRDLEQRVRRTVGTTSVSVIASDVTLSNATPAALGTAAAGSGTSASRDDHVHALPSAYVFGSPDVLTTDAADNALIPWIPGRGFSVSRARGVVKTCPTGAALTIAIKVITMSTGATARTLDTLTISAAAYTGTKTWTADVIAITEALAIEITQVGSTIAGANLAVMVD